MTIFQLNNGKFLMTENMEKSNMHWLQQLACVKKCTRVLISGYALWQNCIGINNSVDD